MNMRLKASELLGRTEGDFFDRLEIDNKITVSQIIMDSYKADADDKSLEDIEAEYQIIREQRKKAKEESVLEDKSEDSLEDLI